MSYAKAMNFLIFDGDPNGLIMGELSILSMPQRVPITWVEEFLTDKISWIESKLKSFQKTSG